MSKIVKEFEAGGHDYYVIKRVVVTTDTGESRLHLDIAEVVTSILEYDLEKIK